MAYQVHGMYYARSRQSAAPPRLDCVAVGFGMGSTGMGPPFDLRRPRRCCSCFVAVFRCRMSLEKEEEEPGPVCALYSAVM